jgi:hypothetical protein
LGAVFFFTPKFIEFPAFMTGSIAQLLGQNKPRKKSKLYDPYLRLYPDQSSCSHLYGIILESLGINPQSLGIHSKSLGIKLESLGIGWESHAC